MTGPYIPGRGGGSGTGTQGPKGDKGDTGATGPAGSAANVTKANVVATGLAPADIGAGTAAATTAAQSTATAAQAAAAVNASRLRSVLGTGMVPVATRGTSYGLGSSNTALTDGGRHTRLPHYALTEFSAVRLVFGNYQMQNANPAEISPGNNIIVKASIEMVNSAYAPFKYVTSSTAYASGTTYAANDVVTASGLTYVSLQASNTGNTPASSPTYWQQVIYYPARFNGATSVTIAPLSVVVSDLIYLQPGPKISQAFYTNTLVQPNNGTANTGSYPAGPYGPTASAAGGFVKKAATGAAPTDYTTSAPTTDVTDGYSSSNPGYGPMAIIGYPKTGGMPVVIIDGDSYTQGANETSPYLFNYDIAAGWVGRLLCDNPTTPTKAVYPHWFSSKANTRDTWQTGNGRACRAVMFPAGSVLLDEQGINDAGMGTLTLAQMQALKIAKWQAAAAIGLPVIGYTLPPETTSTDSWATTTNQTPKTGFGSGSVWQQFNAWLKTFPHPALTAVIDAAAAITDASGLLWNPSYSDGTTGIHPNTAGHIQIATASNVYYATAPSTPVTISATTLFGAAPTS